ncbi:hypothetical protein [Micromonospora chalcea]|uniref:hypothetical protein n=1 Tax=Micromonospora chalcea TaxID=1874 RepID=UPI00157CEC7D|nr:hypothetical protein [Micromonospora chalcea]
MVVRQRPRRRVLPPRRGGSRQPRERAKLTDWVQALSGLLAVAVAIPALIVAGVTYRDQQEINRTQLEMAQLERDRYEKRYASRVAFWWLTYPRDGQSGRLKVQNRSPVPISGITLVGVPAGGPSTPPQQAYLLTTDAPPCVVLTLSLPTLPGDEEFWPWLHKSFGLHFTDPTRSWFLWPTGLQRSSRELSLPRVRFLGAATEVPDTRESAGDCGEGG